MTNRHTAAFIVALGCVGCLFPVTVFGQLRTRPVIGSISATTHSPSLAGGPQITKYSVTLTDSRGIVSNLKLDPATFEYSIVSPRDPSTGMATGKRQHLPVAITEDVSGSSPLLMQVMIQNVNLPAVQFDMIGQGQDGKEVTVETIKLTNASIASYRQFSSMGDGSVRPHLMEELTFTFQKIEVTNHIANTMVTDQV